MAKNKSLLIIVGIAVLAIVIYFSTQQSKVTKTGAGGEIKMGIILGFTGQNLTSRRSTQDSGKNRRLLPQEMPAQLLKRRHGFLYDEIKFSE